VITLIGMAVGVDYSLFYLKREREERQAGRDATAAVEIASATSGRAILISGLTVMVAMAGQFLTGDKSSASFAVGTIMVVAVAMLGSLTALPAMLALLGRHVDKGRIRIPFVRRRSARTESRAWSFVLDRVLARPGLSAIASVAVLLAIASPALHFKIHTTSPNDLAPNLPGIAVYHHLEKAFPNTEMPAVVVVQAKDTNAPQVRGAIAALDRKATAAGIAHEPINTDSNASHTVTTVALPLVGNGTDGTSNDALAQLRDELIPSTLGQVSGVTANVTGETAIDHDQTAMLERNAPLVFGFVLGLAFLLLLVTFRSIVIPIKAIALNLLSVGASYGVLTWVFQDGHLQGLLGYHTNGAVVSWLPLFLFTVLFGLSMDYHVFILSRVKELVDQGVPTEEAVERGIRTTASTVTSAAMVMVAVFAIFATLSTLDIKQMGVGLAVAVLLDATLVRGVLLPATMKLLGDWNWYLPKGLQWLPKIGREPQAVPA
jgi:RND superfamily putative drug exporter